MQIVFTDRPELESRGVRFRATFAGLDVEGLGNCQGEAEDDLHEMFAEHMHDRAEREIEAAHERGAWL